MIGSHWIDDDEKMSECNGPCKGDGFIKMISRAIIGRPPDSRLVFSFDSLSPNLKQK